MKEYTIKKKSTGEEFKAKSLTELSKLTGINRSILARFYYVSKKNGTSKSEIMTDYEPIVKIVHKKTKKSYIVTYKESDVKEHYCKKKDIAQHFGITKYQLKKYFEPDHPTVSIELIYSCD
jgi:hypothetical protein